MWFEHPEEGLEGTWTEHVVTAGPDIGIEVIEDGPYRHEIVVFAAQFFDGKVAMYRVSTTDGTLVDSRIIDADFPEAYTPVFADLNGDGQRDLMVNNHEEDDDLTGIWAYDMPKNWMTGEYTKYQIASGFKNTFSLTVPQMSPGFPYPFYPQTMQEHHIGNPAHILVAGDGDHTAHIMTPTDSKNFIWERDTIKKMGGTVGAMTWADLDEDGWNEVWIPNYDDSKMEVFKFHAIEESFDAQFLQ